jgi:hypothetical protein
MKVRPSKDLKSAKAKAIKYFNAFIRERDKDNLCITCGKRSVSDAGHFISCSFEATRFDERNVHGQCAHCNRYLYGSQYEHSIELDKIHGKGTAESLYLKSKMFCKRNKFDYEHIAQTFKDKLK